MLYAQINPESALHKQRGYQHCLPLLVPARDRSTLPGHSVGNKPITSDGNIFPTDKAIKGADLKDKPVRKPSVMGCGVAGLWCGGPGGLRQQGKVRMWVRYWALLIQLECLSILLSWVQTFCTQCYLLGLQMGENDGRA